MRLQVGEAQEPGLRRRRPHGLFGERHHHAPQHLLKLRENGQCIDSARRAGEEIEGEEAAS